MSNNEEINSFQHASPSHMPNPERRPSELDIYFGRMLRKLEHETKRRRRTRAREKHHGHVCEIENVHTEGKRIWLVGLNHECYTFPSVKDLWQHVKFTLKERAKNVQKVVSAPEFQAQKEKIRIRSVDPSLLIEPIWIDFQGATEEDMQTIAKLFHLHSLTAEDCAHSDTGEKWELFDNYLFVVLMGQDAKQQEATTGTNSSNNDYPVAIHQNTLTSCNQKLVPMNIIIFKNYIITVHQQPIRGMELLLKRIEDEFQFAIDPETGAAVIPPEKAHMYPIPPTTLTRAVSTSELNQFEQGTQVGEEETMSELVDNLFEATSENSSNNPHAKQTQQLGVKWPATSVQTTPVSTMTTTTTKEIGQEQPPSGVGNKGTSQQPYDFHYQQLPTSTSTLVPCLSIRTNMEKKTILPSADWIFYAFLDAIVDVKLSSVEKVAEEVEWLDDQVLVTVARHEHQKMLQNIMSSKDTITFLRQYFLPKQRLVAYLGSKPFSWISQNTQVYMRDVLDHIMMSIDKLDYAKENLNQTHSNYMSKVSMEIAASANRTDALIRRLTIIVSILSPLAVISSLFGMNVRVPGQEIANLTWFYGIVLGGALFVVASLIILRKQLFLSKE